MNPKVDIYFNQGCGRCELMATPQCKVNRWRPEMALLRDIVNSCDLSEELKWGVACYTYNKKNVVIIGAFKEFCSLSFFKGALLRDEKKLLTQPGADSQATRQFKFTDINEIIRLEDHIRAYLFEAIELENSGAKVQFKPIEEYDVPEELQRKLNSDSTLKAAFEALTPGRKRGYYLHIGQAKQSATREARVEKCIPKILKGKGVME